MDYKNYIIEIKKEISGISIDREKHNITYIGISPGYYLITDSISSLIDNVRENIFIEILYKKEIVLINTKAIDKSILYPI